MKIEH